MLWKTTLIVFRVDQVTVHFHVEDPAAAFNEFGINTEFSLDRGRQTGGLWSVVSHHAEFDRDFHFRALCVGER